MDLLLFVDKKVVKKLNQTYDRKKGGNMGWLLTPSVFFLVLSRLFIIFLKIIQKTSKKLYKSLFTSTSKQSITPAQLSQKIKKTSFINLVLYRQEPVKYVINVKIDSTERIDADKIILQEPIHFLESTHPKVSIIIPVYGKVSYTYACLIALHKFLPSNIPTELLVIDDHPSEDSVSVLSGVCTGVRYIKNEENIGFLLSSNKGAELARGEYLVFLNNDTEIQQQWLEALLEVFDTYADAGIVGSKLVYPNKTLQEAGGIIWNDASGWNYGRNGNLVHPFFSYLRKADYCSGASIMIKKSVFESAGRFDERFIPAYYEDTDLCFTVRHRLGLNVYYQPKSMLVHHEGISSGTSTSSGIKKYQLVNATKFQEKWSNELQSYLKNDANHALEAARRHQGEKTVLIIDSYVTKYDRESGSKRLFEIVKIIKSLNYHIVFVPDNYIPEEPYTSTLQALGVEVLFNEFGLEEDVIAQVTSLLHIVDIAWICRPELNEKYIPIVKTNPSIKLIYDTIDLHYLRLKREAELSPETKDPNYWKEVKKLELNICYLTDITITVTEVDKQILLSEHVKSPIQVIPNIHSPYPGPIPDSKNRKGLLFIGSYSHTPNVDAVLWFTKEVLPIIYKSHPDIHVTLLGSSPTEEIRALSSDKISVLGFIEDITEYFLSHKVFISPLRYGAGMKGKIGQSMEFALPVVTTSIGAEGMDLISGQNAMIGDSPEEFAQHVIKLYNDEVLWENVSKNSYQSIVKYSPSQVAPLIKSILSHV